MPLRRSAELDERFGCALLFKDETANTIKSFKGRGTSNYVAQLTDTNGLVCASAGNFGQGLAWAGAKRGIPVTVFASRNAVAVKIEAMRRLGANVILEGDDFDAAKDASRLYAERENLLFVEDGDEVTIAEGAGTLAAEITDEAEFDVMLVPLGNGALASGVGCWVKHAHPDAAMIAVGASGAPAMIESVRSGIIVNGPAATIADGIAVRVPVPFAVTTVREVVDEVVTVEDEHIRMAMALLRDALGLVVEPAGATGFAALIADPDRWRGRRVATPLCGGNVERS